MIEWIWNKCFDSRFADAFSYLDCKIFKIVLEKKFSFGCFGEKEDRCNACEAAKRYTETYESEINSWEGDYATNDLCTSFLLRISWFRDL